MHIESNMEQILSEEEAVNYIHNRIEADSLRGYMNSDYMRKIYKTAIPLFLSEAMFKNGLNLYLSDIFLKRTKNTFESLFHSMVPHHEMLNADLNIHQLFMLCRFRGESTLQNFKDEFLAKTNCEPEKIPYYLEWCSKHKSLPHELKTALFHRTGNSIYLSEQVNELFIF